MKKVLLLAIILLSGMTFTTAQAGKKKDKNKKKAAMTEIPATTLSSGADTLSYAAGYTATQGLKTYLTTQLHVDSAYIPVFIEAFQQAMANANKPEFIAVMAANTVANQVQSQIIPGMGAQLAGTPDSLRLAAFTNGFLAGIREDTTLFTPEKARSLFIARSNAIKEAKEAAYKAQNQEWLAENAKKPGVVVLPSGLQYKVLTQGNGPKPTSDQTVQVVYEGRTIDGNVFDATERHNGAKTDNFRCDQVIPGWTEALTSMPVGSKWEIYIPANLAYGNREAGSIKPNSTLIFTVNLVGIEAPKASAVETVTPATPVTKTTSTPNKRKKTTARRRIR